MILPALIGGWYAVQPRVLAMARERVGYTGSHPVVTETPVMDELIDNDARQVANLRKEEGD